MTNANIDDPYNLPRRASADTATAPPQHEQAVPVNAPYRDADPQADIALDDTRVAAPLAADTINVSQLIDAGGLNPLNVLVVVLGFCIILVDGYDLAALGYAAPALMQAWGIASKSVLGPVFSASLLGMLAGAPLAGYIGDRFGRKTAIVAGCLTLGVFAAASALAASPATLMLLRFCTGIGLGGLIPSLIALTAEYAPRRSRATMTAAMYSGITLGAVVAGGVSAWLVPRYGWPVLFVIGGAAPLLLAAAAALWLPESLKYLIVRGKQPKRTIRLAQRLQPRCAVAPTSRFVVDDEGVRGGFSPSLLFAGDLAAITPLLWTCLAASLAGYYMLASWLPTLLTLAALAPAQAALATAVFQIGGMAGQLIISREIDRRGLAAITFGFAVAIPVVAAIGYALVSHFALLAAVFVSGFCVLGTLGGLNIVSAMMYPIAYRTNGSGWAIAAGRIGAIAGPLAGAYLLDSGLALRFVFVLGATPFIVGLLGSALLVRASARRWRENRSAPSN